MEAIATNQKHDLGSTTQPEALDMTADTITANVHAMNARCKSERMKFIFRSLTDHLHDFVRETSLTTDEWMTAIQFLTETGQKCSDKRQEFILLSDTLGVSSLVDSINNVKPSNATENTVLGPFHTDDAQHVESGESIASEGKGDYMYVYGKVVDTKGRPVASAMIDTWETDDSGQYDTQYANRIGPDCRGRLKTAEDGSYAFRAVVPVQYPIPADGPVGKMLAKLERQIIRPAHLHFLIEAPGYDTLVTALYFKGDPHLNSDAVFGVRTSLIVEPKIINDTAVTSKRGFKETKPHAELEHNFVLASVEECNELKKV